jgi:cytochrome c oxidase subunit 1
MSTTAVSGSPPASTPVPYKSYLTVTRGFASWACTIDHKRIGVMYLVGILTMFFIGGVYAILLRTKHLTPKGEWLGYFATAPQTAGDVYNQWFTLHGAIMVFLVIIPSVPAALGNFVLPLMLGAKDVAFPRLNLWSYYLYVTGALFFVATLLLGGLDTGWTFYVPYSITTGSENPFHNTAIIFALMGVFILGFSSIFTGLNFIVTVHKLRPDGMTWFKMPLFLWAIYATAIIQVLATPVIGITLLLLICERVMKIGIFDPTLGGDPVLYQHFFWFYSHPAVYIMILPGMGIISEIISTFTRRPVFGYRMVAYSSIAIALFGFIVWGHHMFVNGQSPLVTVIFSALTFSVSIPSAIKVFNWLSTMYKGSISLATPMLYALAFLFLFGIGGLTGLFLGALATDVPLHDTYFVVAHFHYVMMGSALIAFIGGIFYWWPKMTGKMYYELGGQISAVLVFVGFNVTFFTQFVLGSQGMPRRYFEYEPRFTNYHVISTIGAYVMAVGFFVAAGVLIHSMFYGRKASANPWGGSTLEWRCPSPPPVENFAVQPHVDAPYDFTHWSWSPDQHEYIYTNGIGQNGSANGAGAHAAPATTAITTQG